MITINLQWLAFLFWIPALWLTGWGLYYAAHMFNDSIWFMVAIASGLTRIGAGTVLGLIGWLWWYAFRH